MEFRSRSGLRLSLWFTTGDVVNTRSWIYRGEWHYETWIRNTDGREWRATSGLLGTSVNRGHRLALAWCGANGATTGDLVAVRNCTTAESRVIGQAIATKYDRRAYGRWGMLLTLLVAAVIWQGGHAAALPAIVTAHWAPSLLVLTLFVGLIGFLFSKQVDPDPQREVDQKVQLALAGMEYAWRELQREAAPAQRRGRGGPRGRSPSAFDEVGPQRTNSRGGKMAKRRQPLSV